MHYTDVNMNTFVYSIFTILLIRHSHTVTSHSQENALSFDWLHSCHSRTDGSLSHVHIFCHVTNDDTWDFNDFRNWSLSRDMDTRVSVDVDCDRGGAVCLPWPYRSPRLDSLVVRGCVNTCYFSDFNRPQVLKTPDTLRVFESYNMTVKTNILDTIRGDIILADSADLDCGPRGLEAYVYRGTKYEFTVPNEKTGFSQEQLISSAFKNSTSNGNRACMYNEMTVFDLSQSEDAASSLIRTFVNASFPELRTLNLSCIHLETLPLVLMATIDKFPKLETLDLSHNNIAFLDIHPNEKTTMHKAYTTILQYNAIEAIGQRDLDLFRNDARVFDIRNNPLICDCSMIDFCDYLRMYSSPVEAGLDSGYGYLWNLTCAGPPGRRGRRVYDLSPASLCNTRSSEVRQTVPSTCECLAVSSRLAMLPLLLPLLRL